MAVPIGVPGGGVWGQVQVGGGGGSPLENEGKRGGVGRVGGGVGTGKGTGKSMRKLCRNYLLATCPLVSPRRMVVPVHLHNFSSVSRRGGRNKGGRTQMRANANKRRQTLTNASKRRGENASKHEQMWTNANKRLHPPLFQERKRHTNMNLFGR